MEAKLGVLTRFNIYYLVKLFEVHKEEFKEYFEEKYHGKSDEQIVLNELIIFEKDEPGYINGFSNAGEYGGLRTNIKKALGIGDK